MTQFLKDHGFVLNVKNVTVSKFLHLFEKKSSIDEISCQKLLPFSAFGALRIYTVGSDFLQGILLEQHLRFGLLLFTMVD